MDSLFTVIIKKEYLEYQIMIYSEGLHCVNHILKSNYECMNRVVFEFHIHLK